MRIKILINAASSPSFFHDSLIRGKGGTWAFHVEFTKPRQIDEAAGIYRLASAWGMVEGNTRTGGPPLPLPLPLPLPRPFPSPINACPPCSPGCRRRVAVQSALTLSWTWASTRLLLLVPHLLVIVLVEHLVSLVDLEQAGRERTTEVVDRQPLADNLASCRLVARGEAMLDHEHEQLHEVASARNVQHPMASPLLAHGLAPIPKSSLGKNAPIPKSRINSIPKIPECR